jgi:hypothetical protein
MNGTIFSRRALLSSLAAAPALGLGAARAQQRLPRIAVNKDPGCGCCTGWIQHLQADGFTVDVIESSSAKLDALKQQLGVPTALASCHTALIESYVIEGHVPAGAIRRLLAEKPKATGLAVPGMPVGSPGMEVPGSPPDVYDVILFGPDQRRFARYRGGEEI